MTIKEEKAGTAKAKSDPKVKDEVCVCEICTCGRHRCPHNNYKLDDHVASEIKTHTTQSASATESQEQYQAFSQIERQKIKRPQTALKLDSTAKMETTSSYTEEFHQKQIEEQKRFKRDQHTLDFGEDNMRLGNRNVTFTISGAGDESDDWQMPIHQSLTLTDSDQKEAGLGRDSGYPVKTTIGHEDLTEHSSSTSKVMMSTMSTSAQHSTTSKSSKTSSDNVVSSGTTILHSNTGDIIQSHQPVPKTRKQLRGGKLVDVIETVSFPDSSTSMSTSYSTADSKFTAEHHQTGQEKQFYEQVDHAAQQSTISDSIDSEGKRRTIATHGGDVSQTKEGKPFDISSFTTFPTDGASGIPSIEHKAYDKTGKHQHIISDIPRMGDVRYELGGVTIPADASTEKSTTTFSQSNVSSSQHEMSSSRHEIYDTSTSDVHDRSYQFDALGSNTPHSSQHLDSSAIGRNTPNTYPAASNKKPQGPRTIIRGGVVHKIPAEPGYYDQFTSPPRDLTSIQEIDDGMTGEVGDYDKSHSTRDPSGLTHETTTTSKFVQDGSHRYEEIGTRIPETTHITTRVIRTLEDGTVVETSSTTSEIGSNRKPQGPRTILRAGVVHRIPAEPGYHDQFDSAREITSIQEVDDISSRKHDQQGIREHEKIEYFTHPTLDELVKDGTHSYEKFDTIIHKSTDHSNRITASIDDISPRVSGANVTLTSDTLTERKPQGPRSIIRGGVVQHIPAEPGYYDQLSSPREIKSMHDIVDASGKSVRDVSHFEKTDIITHYEHSPTTTTTTTFDKISSERSGPFSDPDPSQLGSDKKPQGPRTIIRGGIAHKIPADEGYYAQFEPKQRETTSIEKAHETTTTEKYAIDRADRFDNIDQTSKLSHQSDTRISFEDLQDKRPEGPKTIIRGGTLHKVPADPGYYDQFEPTAREVTSKYGTTETTEQKYLTEHTGHSHIIQTTSETHSDTRTTKHVDGTTWHEEDAPTGTRPSGNRIDKKPEGPKTFLKGGTVHTVPAEPGYYDQFDSALRGVSSTREAYETTTGKYDETDRWRKIVQTTETTPEPSDVITEKRFADTFRGNEVPITGSTTSDRNKKPEGPKTIIRGGTVHKIPAEPGYYDQFEPTTKEAKSRHDIYETTEKYVTDRIDHVDKIQSSGTHIKTSETRTVKHSDDTPRERRDQTPTSSDKPNDKKPEGPKTIIRGGTVHKIPAEPGYYDQFEPSPKDVKLTREVYETTETHVTDSTDRLNKIKSLKEAPAEPFDKTTNVFDATQKRGEPATPSDSDRDNKPEGPKAIIRGGTVHKIPAEPGYYDQFEPKPKEVKPRHEVYEKTEKFVTDSTEYFDIIRSTSETPTAPSDTKTPKNFEDTPRKKRDPSAPISDSHPDKKPEGPKTIIRGGTVHKIPAEPGYYNQFEPSPKEVKSKHEVYETTEKYVTDSIKRLGKPTEPTEHVDKKTPRHFEDPTQKEGEENLTPSDRRADKKPEGPKTIIRGGTVHKIPAEPGYYDQFEPSPTEVKSRHEIYETTEKYVTDSLKRSDKTTEPTEYVDKKTPKHFDDPTQKDGEQSVTPSDRHPDKKPEGPKTIIRGGTVHKIPAEPGYYDQFEPSPKEVKSRHEIYETTEKYVTDSIKRLDKTIEPTENVDKKTPKHVDDPTQKEGEENLTPSDRRADKKPEGPKTIIRGGTVHKIPAEPGYYDQFEPSPKEVKSKHEVYETTEKYVTDSIKRLDKTIEPTEHVGKKTPRHFEDPTQKKGEENLTPSDPRPDKKPEGPKTIIRGGTVHKIPADPGYYDQFEPTSRDIKPRYETVETTTPEKFVTDEKDRLKKAHPTSQKYDEPSDNRPDRKPEGPKTIIRGGTVRTIPAEPGYYDQFEPTPRETKSTHEPRETTPDDGQSVQPSSKLPKSSDPKTPKKIDDATDRKSKVEPIESTPEKRQGKKPEGPKTIIRGGTVHKIPAEPGYYDQLEETHKAKSTPTPSTKDKAPLTGPETIRKSEKIIEESAKSLREIATELNDVKRTKPGKKPEPKKVPSTSTVDRDETTERDTTISSAVEKRSSTSKIVDHITDVSTTHTEIVPRKPKETITKGSTVETMSSGTLHDFGDVQGMTVVSRTKTSSGQTIDQREAQADLERLIDSKKIYGVDIESTLSKTKVKKIHEEEISSGTVRIGESGIETTENVVKSVTEIKTARVKDGQSKDTIEVDERVSSSTTSTDQQTFKFHEISMTDAERKLREVKRRNDIMKKNDTHPYIEYTDDYQRDLDNEKILKTGQVLVEEMFDTKTSFESTDSRDRIKSRAHQDETLTTTTVLEKSEPKPLPRVQPIRRDDNLKIEGTVDYQVTSRKDFDDKTNSDRTVVVRRNTFTKPEGDMYLESTTQSQYPEFPKGERFEPKRPEDSLKSEGPFYGKPKEPAPVGERAKGKKPEDSLFPEGEFYRPPDRVTPGKGERFDRKIPEDNLKPEGVFYQKPKEEAPLHGDRVQAKKPIDNLTSEGPFYEKPREDAPIGEKRSPIRHPDNLKPENGEFAQRPAGVFPTIERSQPIKQKDSLYPEGDFYKRPVEEFPAGEKRTPIKQIDNLSPSGPFYGKPKEPAPIGERAKGKKPEDSLFPEGEFYRPPDRVTPTKGERFDRKIPEDNLKPEGTFYERPKEDAPLRGERAPTKKPIDNLTSEGIFYQKPKEDAPFGEKRTPIRHPDNLTTEGPFYEKPKEGVPTGEKRKPIRHPDNLKPEDAEFTQRTKEDITVIRGDRFDVRKPKDNLTPEGVFYEKPREDAPFGEKRKPIRHEDNLTPEGIFYERPKEEIPVGERRKPIRHPDNLTPEGPFYQKPKEDTPIGERRKPIRHPDNLKPEDVEFTQRTRDDTVIRGDRFDIKKPKDNLITEGQFYEKPKDETPVGEKRKPIRHADNLTTEGPFYEKPREDAPIGEKRKPIRHADNLKPEDVEFTQRIRDDTLVRGDRYDVKKPKDNLVPEGKFYEKPKEETPIGEKRKPIRHEDNLTTEGEFYGKPKEDAPAGEKRKPIRHPDNLKPEDVEFTQRIREETVIRGDRFDVKKPKDNLTPEGQFYEKPKEDAPTGEKRKPIRHADNLTSEGPFYEKPREDAPIGEKRKPIRHADNLKPEDVEFTQRIREDTVMRGDRFDVKKPKDNLTPEGKFYDKPKEDVPTGEKRKPIRHADNLTSEGPFYEKPREDAPIGERRKPIRHEDNLKPEDVEFTQRIREDTVIRGDRFDVKKPKDNLTPEGKFYEKPKDDAPTGEKRKPIRHADNLTSEGPFYEKPREDAPIGERRKPIRHEDNLKPEDVEFTQRIREETIIRGDRFDIKKPKDNLTPEGKFYEKPKEDAPTGEKRKPIRPADNLTTEGQFYEKPKEDAPIGEKRKPIRHADNLQPEDAEFTQRTTEDWTLIQGDRYDVKKPKDNLTTEGTFYEKPKEDAPVGERRKPIRHPDNLKPEDAEFTQRTREETIVRGERYVVKKPEDNLSSEGPFYGKPKDDVPVGERRQPIRHADNLTPEGRFYEKPKEDAPFGEKRKPIRHDDNLTSEGVFYERPKEDAPMGERRKPIRHPDNLKPEDGEFTQRPVEAFPSIERSQVIKQKDSLYLEGEFYKRPVEDAPIGERRTPIKQPDNLATSGPFYGKPHETAPLKGDRADIRRPVDNLKQDGEVDFGPKPKSPTKGDRYDVKKPKDNLFPGGEFYEKPKEKVPFGEKRSPVKPTDNLHVPDGKFTEKKPEDGPLRGERADVKKPVDNLKPGGKFYERPKDVVQNAEKRSPIKPDDTLKPEGEFYKRPKDVVHVKGDRAERVVHEDTLRLEGRFTDVTTSREDYQEFTGEKRKTIRQKDQIEVEHRPLDKITSVTHDEFRKVVGDRADIKVHEDHLRVTGVFRDSTTSQSDYTGTVTKRTTTVFQEDNLRPLEGSFPQRKVEPGPVGERRTPIKHTDNIYTEGPFYDKPKEDAPLRGEKASPIRHADNLRPEGEFYKRPEAVSPGPGDRAPIRKPEDNLHPSGPFYGKPTEEVPRGEKRSPVKHPDNLFPEGEFYQKPKDGVKAPGDRAPIKKPVDNLKVSEGDFYERPKDPTPVKGERMPVKKPEDNLKLGQGEFTQRTKVTQEIIRGDRAEVKRPVDNLTLNGSHEPRPKSPAPVKGERAPIKKPTDNLKMEGKMDILEKSTSQIVRGDRVQVVKRSDNLKVGEGSMDLVTTSGRATSQQQKQSLLESKMQSSIIQHQHQASKTQRTKQTSSQIILGDDLGDARFERTSTGRRTTVENRNLPNGHLHQEKSIESTVRQAAETKTTEDRSVEQKVLSQAMSAKSTMNQSLTLNNVDSKKLGIESGTHSSDSTSPQRQVVESRTTQKQQQLDADKKGTVEVQVTREVTVTKRSGTVADGDPVTTSSMTTRRLPSGQIVTTTETTTREHQQDMSETSSHLTQHLRQQQRAVTSSGEIIQSQLPPDQQQRISPSSTAYPRGEQAQTTYTSSQLNQQDMKGRQQHFTDSTDQTTQQHVTGRRHYVTSTDYTTQQQKNQQRHMTSTTDHSTHHARGQYSQVMSHVDSTIQQRDSQPPFASSMDSTTQQAGGRQPQFTSPVGSTSQQIRSRPDSTTASPDHITHQQARGQNPQITTSTDRTTYHQTKGQQTHMTSSAEHTTTHQQSRNLPQQFSPEHIRQQQDITYQQSPNYTYSTSHQPRDGMSSSSSSVGQSPQHGVSSPMKSGSQLHQGSPSSSGDANASRTDATMVQSTSTVIGRDSSSSRRQHQDSTSTHSRIIETSRGVGGKDEWTSRHEAVGKDSFASHLRESSGGQSTLRTSSEVIRGGNEGSTIHRQSDTRKLSSARGDSHCPLHTSQEHHTQMRTTPTSASSTQPHGISGTTSFSHNQYQQNQGGNNGGAGSRSSKVVHSDNLGLSRGTFEGSTSSRSAYGGHYQVTERVVPVRSTQQSSISLGSYNNPSTLDKGKRGEPSSYKKEFTRQEIKPCPATLLESGKSPYKYQRQSSSHRFYMPNVSD